jgi:chromate transport protein
MKQLPLLIYYFFTTGLFSIGGGLATLPFLYEIGRKTGWYTAGDVANMVAIAQSTPGPTGINMSTYVGYMKFGILGAVLGPIAIVAPSFIVIIIVSKLLNKFKESKLVQDSMYGLRAASTGLIFAAAFSVIEISIFNFGNTGAITEFVRWPSLALAGFVLALHLWKKPHPIVLIVLSGFIGVIFEL